jgi:hypothetical protein
MLNREHDRIHREQGDQQVGQRMRTADRLRQQDHARHDAEDGREQRSSEAWHLARAMNVVARAMMPLISSRRRLGTASLIECRVDLGCSANRAVEPHATVSPVNSGQQRALPPDGRDLVSSISQRNASPT